MERRTDGATHTTTTNQNYHLHPANLSQFFPFSSLLSCPVPVIPSPYC